MEPDGVDSDDASTIIEARPSTTVTHLDNDRLSNVCDVGTSGSDTYITAREEFLVNDVPATPKTPYQEDELPSVPCTPCVDEGAMFEPLVNAEPATYDFTNCLDEWDWDRSGGSQFLASHTRISKTSNRPKGNKRHERPPAQISAVLKDTQPKNLDHLADLFSEETKPRMRNGTGEKFPRAEFR